MKSENQFTLKYPRKKIVSIAFLSSSLIYLLSLKEENFVNLKDNEE